jgi:uncharacterized protein (TIGR03118 family)
MRIIPIGIAFGGLALAMAPACSSNNTSQSPLVSQGVTVTNLVSNIPALGGSHTDPRLVNAWGLASGSSTQWWVANNGTGFATVYDEDGVKQPLEVDLLGTAPTGLVFSGGLGFRITQNGLSGPSSFLFATEDGKILAWSAEVNSPPGPNPTTSTPVVVAFDSSSKGAVYKGIALASTRTGSSRLYATDFHNGVVDVFDESFVPVSLPPGAFVDPKIPRGFAPFGIRSVGGLVIVTYALQDADQHDDVSGPGNGFVDAFDADGNLALRVATQGDLNSPWGLALAPDQFVLAANLLLVGNFGDGTIHAFDLTSCGGDGCSESGPLQLENGNVVQIDRLWALDFGKGNGQSGSQGQLFFTAGPNNETNGLFGVINTGPAVIMGPSTSPTPATSTGH